MLLVFMKPHTKASVIKIEKETDLRNSEVMDESIVTIFPSHKFTIRHRNSESKIPGTRSEGKLNKQKQKNEEQINLVC